MPSHLTAIGFQGDTRQDFANLAMQAIKTGQTMKTSGGASYCVWALGEGIELWAQLDQRGELIGLNPHFRGGARMEVGLTRRVYRPQDSALDGAFFGWAGASPSNPQAGEYPFVFDVPDYRLHEALQLPKTVSVQLAAFAHRLEAFANEQAMRASGGWMSSMAAESCIPSGIFTPDGAPIDPPKSEVIVCGRVLEATRHTNPITKRTFHWARIHTLGGEIDMVADPAIIKGTIVQQGIIGGVFWLSGRVS